MRPVPACYTSDWGASNLFGSDDGDILSSMLELTRGTPVFMSS